ncbi:MAG: 4Fe-4S binding protein [Firmicutes bacterium]|mgnify:CR=1 FL=1|nr:4Fe-4S binding protein [Bacillota bacterium]
MNLHYLGKTGIKVTELCFGVLPLGPLQKNLTLEAAVRLLQTAIGRGLNFFDTAESYQTQQYLGRALAGQERQQLVLATKSAAETYEGMKLSVEKSLDELNTDYIDIYHLHAARVTPAVFTEREGALACLTDMKKQGKIRAVGISTHSVSVVEAAAKRDDIDVVFPIINILGRGIQDGTKEDMIRAIGKAATAGQGVYAMKVLAGGHLVSEVPAAMTYVRQIPGVSSIAVGMVDEAELNYNIELFKFNHVSPECAAAVQADHKRLIVLGFCRGCGACVNVCPNQALSLVGNKARVDNDKCILCGYCNPVCPEFALRIV